MNGKDGLFARVSVGLAIVALFGSLSGPVPASASGTLTLPLFGPESFVRNTGAPSPVVRTFNVPAAQGTFTLDVINGTGGGDNAVSSAVVEVNGTTILKANDFNQNISRITRTLTNLGRGRTPCRWK